MKYKKIGVYGVGINDADYPIQRKIYQGEGINRKQVVLWTCPFYAKWQGMLERCYSHRYQEKYPTYVGCFVSDEWLLFSNFRGWMLKQDWEDKILDKDLIKQNNKEYSEDTCIFVDRKVNLFICEKVFNKGLYPTGVDLHKGKFRARGRSADGKNLHLGYFNTELEAHKAWVRNKIITAKELASQQTDGRIAQALLNKYENMGEQYCD